jgi:FkbM family methyltransferase
MRPMTRLETLAAAMIRRAGRFSPTRRPALKAMLRLRRADLLPRTVEGEVNGRYVVLDLDEPVDAKLFVFGAFDLRGLKLMRRVISASLGRTILDVGANIGNHTAFFCDWAGEVVAFEPNPPVHARLLDLVTVNRLDNVRALAFGLSDRNGTLDFFVNPGAAGLSSMDPQQGSVHAGQVPVRRGDDVVAELGLTGIDFVKIDVEGHEWEVMSGLAGTIARDRPFIVAEFGESSIRKFASREALSRMLPGYRIYGTGETLVSHLFKTALSAQTFVFGQDYSHILCVPEERVTALGHVLRLPD